MKNTQTRAAFTLLEKENKILMLQEGGELAYGLWCFPGGHVENNESFEEGAIREALEESGYEISIKNIIFNSIIPDAEYKGSKGDTKKVELKIFRADIIGGDLKKDDQSLDIKWLTMKDLITLPLRWGLIKDLITTNPSIPRDSLIDSKKE